MPPKAKFTKQEIINASIEIIETTGIDTLTARSLGRQTRKFCQTLFTVFDSMEEVLSATFAYANEIYESYVKTDSRNLCRLRSRIELRKIRKRTVPNCFVCFYERKQANL